jgi:two-component system sensor histidine kinase UhpB
MIHRVRRADPDAGAERRFQRLLENAPDLIYRYRVASPRGYDYINAACIAITGRPPEAFYADPVLALACVHPDDRDIIVQAFQDDPARLQLAIRIRWVHPDGRIVCAEHRRVPVLDRHGRIVAIEGVGRDITANLEIETQLRESERQLKRLAASMQSAREEERAHLSRELHDELGQTLTILNMDLTRTVRDLIPLALPPDLVDRMQSMVGNIDLAAETVRRLASTLRPPALDHLGLAAAIELEAAALARRTGLRCRVAGSLRTAVMTPAQTTAVFRIVQEALTNIVRHADASAVRVTMRQTARSIAVRIHDNGRGISGEVIDDPQSIGLLGMRERAELAGARLSITARSGKGTDVLIAVPVTPARGARRG